MLGVDIWRQMAGKGGRALGGREGGVMGLFPRRREWRAYRVFPRWRRADPNWAKCLRRAARRRQVRAHILGDNSTGEVSWSLMWPWQTQKRLTLTSSSSDDCGGVTSGVGSGWLSRWQKWCTWKRGGADQVHNPTYLEVWIHFYAHICMLLDLGTPVHVCLAFLQTHSSQLQSLQFFSLAILIPKNLPWRHRRCHSSACTIIKWL